MDRKVVEKLGDAGIDGNFEGLVPGIGIRLDAAAERVMPLSDEADVVAGGGVSSTNYTDLVLERLLARISRRRSRPRRA